jgi:hypothetical protein
MLNKHLTTNDVLQCDGSPIDNNLMPEYVGQLCIDITNELVYIAKMLDESGWIAVVSSEEEEEGNINEFYESTITVANTYIINNGTSTFINDGTSATIDNIKINGKTIKNEETEVLISAGQSNGITITVSNGTDSNSAKLSYTLRSLPDGTCDTIEKRNGKYVLIKRCGEVTLNGDEDWAIGTQSNDSTIKPFVKNAIPDAISNGININLHCNMFESKYIYNDNILDEGVYSSETLNVHTRILKEKASNLDEFKALLASHPMILIYELNDPIITEIENISLSVYSGTNTITVNSGVAQSKAWIDLTFTKVASVPIDINFLFNILGRTELQTEEKTVTAAINEMHTELNSILQRLNELFQNVSNGKTLIATAITDKGTSASSSETFESLANKIRQIKTETRAKFVE